MTDKEDEEVEREEITFEMLMEELNQISDDIIGCRIAKECPELEWKCSQCPGEFGECINYNANAISVISMHLISLYNSLGAKTLKKIKNTMKDIKDNIPKNNKSTSPDYFQ